MTDRKSQVNSPEASPKSKTADRGFSKLYNDIVPFFHGYRDILGTYGFIIRETAWGVFPTGKFRKKVIMQPGEFITSYANLKKMTGIHLYNLKWELSILEAMGAIRIEKRSKTLIAIFPTYTAENSIKDIIKRFPKPQTKIGKKSNSSGPNRKQQFGAEPLNSSGPNRLNQTNSSGPNDSSNSLLYPKEDLIKEEGEKKTENPPPFESEKESGTATESGTGTPNPIESEGLALSDDAKETCRLWLDRTRERVKSKVFTLTEITADLVKIQKETSVSWDDLLVMVKVLNASTTSIAKKFTKPSEWNADPFKDGKIYLDKAMELVHGPEGKALKKIAKEKELEEQKEYRKPRIVNNDYTDEEIERRRLARIEERKSWG